MSHGSRREAGGRIPALRKFRWGFDMSIEKHFDAVVMLTWSDWKTEPRSNRYHYASRFSKLMPTLFVQLQHTSDATLSVERTELPNLDLVHGKPPMDQAFVDDFLALLYARGISQPLVWIYDPMRYHRLIDAMPKAFKVFHATENFIAHTAPSLWHNTEVIESIRASIHVLAPKLNLVIGVTKEIAASYEATFGYRVPSACIQNGCDAEYFLERLPKMSQAPSSAPPSAIYQGGINSRLNYKLLSELARRMPDWDFHFCGKLTPSPGWSKLLNLANVKYHGNLAPDEFTKRICDATVGIIPFVGDQWIQESLPLKAFEYVACGLPVVSVPITALEKDKDFFTIARDAEEFERELRRLAPSRWDPALLERRKALALANSYSSRFKAMCGKLLLEKAAQAKRRGKMNVCILYDTASTHVNTVREHLEAFDKYSRHRIAFIPATSIYWRSSNQSGSHFDLSSFDVAILHYSARISFEGFVDNSLVNALTNFRGLKILFIQDEYDNVERTRVWMDTLRFDLVYTCVPQASRELVYPSSRFPGTKFLPTLTGYVPERCETPGLSIPLQDRKTLIAYRGRKLPAIYGELGYEKYRIGVEMKEAAAKRGLAVDIECDDCKRIYGDAWHRFIGSARATLGTESGSNVFDFTGELAKRLKKFQKENPNASFEEIHAKLLAGVDGKIRMNQISPKIFEAIVLRTALVLFEGDYSGVVKPDIHFIPLKKDFSNVDDVIAKVMDDEYILRMTETAYRDIVASGAYSYRSFVEGIDADIEERMQAAPKPAALLATGMIDSKGAFVQTLPFIPDGVAEGIRNPAIPANILRKDGTLSLAFFSMTLARLGGKLRQRCLAMDRRTLPFRGAKFIWENSPHSIKDRVRNFLDCN